MMNNLIVLFSVLALLFVILVLVVIPTVWLIWKVRIINRRERRVNLEQIRAGLEAGLRPHLSNVRVITVGNRLEIRCPLSNGRSGRAGEICIGSVPVPTYMSRGQVIATIKAYNEKHSYCYSKDNPKELK